jgi:two-component system response regulator FixJ
MSHKGNVFVIDDDPAMRDSLDFLLGSAGFKVTLFDTAADFLDAHAGLRFGCLISDVRMPDINGMDLLRRLKANASSLPVIIMTGHGDIPLAVEAMKLGAFDFVEKPFEDERLIGMIEAALQQSPNRTKSGAISAEIASRIASLSQRERQVMDGLVAGLSNKLIAREHNISPRTIEVYRANVMTKMQAHNLSELIRLALRAGILND